MDGWEGSNHEDRTTALGPHEPRRVRQHHRASAAHPGHVGRGQL